MMASYSVLAMIKCKPDEFRVFYEHHRAHGAERLYIFFDGVIDEIVSAGFDVNALATSGVELFAMDDKFWTSRGTDRPNDFIDRRRYVHRYGKMICQSDWLFICDEDEFLISSSPVGDLLDIVPGDIDAVVINMAEAVWGPKDDLCESYGSTWFRRPFPSFVAWHRDRIKLYGPLAILFVRGLAGHDMGKQFIRTTADFDKLDTHRCWRDGKIVSVYGETIGLGSQSIEMLHFDAISYDRWLRKCSSRVLDPTINRLAIGHRRRQERLFRFASFFGSRVLILLFLLIYRVSNRQLRFLERRGLAFQNRAILEHIPINQDRILPQQTSSRTPLA